VAKQRQVFELSQQAIASWSEPQPASSRISGSTKLRLGHSFADPATGSPQALERIVTKKFADMEALRGLAALGVVIYHYLYGFVPAAGLSTAAPIGGVVMVDRPVLLAFINGPFLVSIFFVLSSFVLTTRLVREADPRVAIIAMAKRFPRLFPLTLIGALVPALLFAAGWTYNHSLAEVIGSSWLERSGGVKIWDEWPTPSVFGGVRDSILLFGRGYSQYNSALWTMKYELVGSIFALATAMLMGARQSVGTDSVITLVLGVVGLTVHPLISICVATVFVTKYVAHPNFKIDPLTVAFCIIGGLILGSTYKSVPEELLIDPWTKRQVLRLDWLVHGAGAILLFLGVRGASGSAFGGGSIGMYLGRLSFPLYVLHLPVFASVASGLILFLGYSEISVLLAFFVSMGVLFAISHPVAMLDEWCVGRLNAMLRRLYPRRARALAVTADPAP
jgi:peptidoglycan/LPS O-acetylase OafA/YrhL